MAGLCHTPNILIFHDTRHILREPLSSLLTSKAFWPKNISLKLVNVLFLSLTTESLKPKANIVLLGPEVMQFCSIRHCPSRACVGYYALLVDSKVTPSSGAIQTMHAFQCCPTQIIQISKYKNTNTKKYK